MNRTFGRATLLVVLCFAAALANMHAQIDYGGGWYYLNTLVAQKRVVLVNPNQVSKLPSGRIRIWTKEIMDTAMLAGANREEILQEIERLSGYKNFGYNMSLFEFDCFSHKYSWRVTLSYDTGGQLIERTSASEPDYAPKWDYIIPDTVVDVLSQVACILSE